MPRRQPTIDWQQIRVLTERWAWRDLHSGVEVTGFNPPANVKAIRKAFFVKYITQKGICEEGVVVCLKVFLKTHQRLVMFVESGQMRRVNDILIREIDGIRVVAG